MVKKKKKYKIHYGRIIAAFLVLVVIIASIVAAGAYFYIDYKLNHGKDTYIAILGTDERSNQTTAQRSDVMMLAYISFEDSSVDLISMPRDSLVTIPCEDNAQDKITHAYHYGQTACVLDTLEKVFDINEITSYVRVNFDSLIMLVDDLGGVTITPSKSFCEYNVKKTEKYCFEEGKSVDLDGAKALAYSRHRKSDSDIYRTQRQQQVLMAMISKAKKLDILTIYKLGGKVLKEIDTNVSLFDAMTYYKLATREEFTLTKTVAKGSDDYINGVYYYRLSKTWLAEMKEKMKK